MIFVGLNRSDAIKRINKINPLSNFHTPGHVGDRRLKRFIQDLNLKNLVGGFMTDLSAQIETNSNKVIIHDSAAEELINRVRSIPNLQTRHLICFGNKVFDTLAKKLEINKTQFNKIPEYELKVFSKQINNENWHFYRVWHYSNYGGLIHKSEVVLPVQLKYINDNIGRVGFNQSTKRVEFD